jgi:16S rRNA (cytidine1402-2'-O)-methyltransferase
MGTVFVIGTPIGNLKDITLRALETLRFIDIVVAEHQKISQNLLRHYGITGKKFFLLQQNPKKKTILHVLQLLREGKNVGIFTDAGTPGISDPGGFFIDQLLTYEPRLRIVPIPGPSALTTAISISGVPSQRILFLGFPPKRGTARKEFFNTINEMKGGRGVVVFFESPHRIRKTLLDIAKTTSPPTRKIVICRELTKVFEEIRRITIGQLLEIVPRIQERGEYVIVIF